MDSPRGKAYIWASWLKGLLAGTDQCQWRVWKKAHFRYAKKPDDGSFDVKEWTRQHDAMVQNRAARLGQHGYEVTVEDDNAFKIDGRTATVAGKADLIGVKKAENRALIVDEKSGRKTDADRWQVMIYIYAFRRLRLRNFDIDGEVEYRGDSTFITPDEYTSEVDDKVTNVIRIVGGDPAPPHSPSASECRFCDILSCEMRWKDKTETVEVKEF